MEDSSHLSRKLKHILKHRLLVLKRSRLNLILRHNKLSHSRHTNIHNPNSHSRHRDSKLKDPL